MAIDEAELSAEEVDSDDLDQNLDSDDESNS